MQKKTEKKLIEAWNYCNENNKSMEFTIEYMCDVADVNIDCVIKFINKQKSKNDGLQKTI